MAEKFLKIEYDDTATVDITVTPAQRRQLDFAEFEKENSDLIDIIMDAADTTNDPNMSVIYQGYLLGKMEVALHALYHEAEKVGISVDDVQAAYDAMAQSPVFDRIDVEKADRANMMMVGDA